MPKKASTKHSAADKQNESDDEMSFASIAGERKDMVGKRCRVYYDLGNDFFGRQNSAVAHGWYFGEIAAAARPRKT